jgi:hypothetical protein
LRKPLPSILRNVERLPPFWSYCQSEVYRRKQHTIGEEVMEIVEDMAESIDKRRHGSL